MKKCFNPVILCIIGILFLLPCSLVQASTYDEIIDKVMIAEDAQTNFNNAETSSIGLYYTLSNSGSSEALHFQIPFVLRIIKNTGGVFFALIYYDSPDAKTTIVDRFGNIISEVHGKHGVFLFGAGVLGFNGGLFKSPIWFAAMSIIPPVIFD